MSHNQNHNPEPVGAHAVGSRSRRRPWWLALALALAALILFLLLLSRCNTETTQPGPGSLTSLASSPAAGLQPSSTTQSLTEPGSSSGSSSAGITPSRTTTATPTTDSGAGAGRDSALTVNGDPLLPAAKPGSKDALSTYVGKPVTATQVTVQSVDADEGFWVGNDTTDRVWVQLVGKGGESSYQVKVGDRLSFPGELVKNPRAFAEKVGVSAQEGAAQLTQQGAHIEVDKSKLNQN